MKIILTQVISLQTYGEGYFNMKKEFESEVIPHIGDKITDLVWSDPYEYPVVDVVIDYQQKICTVTLEQIQFEHNDKEYLKRWYDMVKSHGWNTGELLV